mgnify:CR=1 FL=1
MACIKISPIFYKLLILTLTQQTQHAPVQKLSRTESYQSEHWKKIRSHKINVQLSAKPEIEPGTMWLQSRDLTNCANHAVFILLQENIILNFTALLRTYCHPCIGTVSCCYRADLGFKECIN